MVMSSIAAGSLAGFWTVLSMIAADGRGPQTADQSSAPPDTLASDAALVSPCDDLPHQALVMGCVHAQDARERDARSGDAPPPSFLGPDGGALVGEDTDVLHYFLDISITPSPANITGTNTITVKCLQNGVNTFGIQLNNVFTITSMTVNSIPVSWVRLDSANITVTLDHTYNANDQFDLAVAYTGTPVSVGGFGSINFTTHSGSQVVFTLSEPYYAYTWWPVKEDNRDKATGDMWFTVPNTMAVASNGIQQGIDVIAGNKLRFRWKTNYPTAPYLFSFAATNYTLFTDTWNYTGGSMPMSFYIYPENDTTNNRNAWLATKQMLTTFATKYGQYPFVNEKYGIYSFGFGGGMEHQTMTGQGTFSESTTAHELSHQWWGDKTTCATFNHIWLNEGFADYSEAIWLEFKPGSTGTPALQSAMAARRPSSPYGQTVYRFDISNATTIFDTNSVYYKGGWVLHMLRHVLAGVPGGDANFFNMLQTYSATYAYAPATTEDLQAIAEQYYGSSLNSFFQQWVYSPGAPTYQIASRRLNVGGGEYVELYVNQNQVVSYPNVFVMPVDVRVALVVGGPYNTRINNDARTEHFLIPLPSQAALTNPVTLDPDSYILRPAVTNVAFVEGPPKVVKVTPDPGSSTPSGSVPNIQIVFHKNVNATAGNFAITGNSTGAVPFTFAYNSGTFTATLTPTSPLASDTYSVGVSSALTDVAAGKSLDGEVADPNSTTSLPSGDGLPGGNFAVNIIIQGALCAGNANGDGVVDIDDLVLVITNWGWTGTPGFNPADVTGNGVVDIDDLVSVITHWGACP